MKYMAMVVVALSVASCVAPAQPSERTVPACDIDLSRIAGTIVIDIGSSCGAGAVDDEWTLEYRLLASGLVTANRRDRPCGSLTHVEVLATTSVADMTATGWLYRDGQRVDCTVTASN